MASSKRSEVGRWLGMGGVVVAWSVACLVAYAGLYGVMPLPIWKDRWTLQSVVVVWLVGGAMVVVLGGITRRYSAAALARPAGSRGVRGIGTPMVRVLTVPIALVVTAVLGWTVVCMVAASAERGRLGSWVRAKSQVEFVVTIFWPLGTIAAAAVSLKLGQVWARRRAINLAKGAFGRCLHCGYDLAGIDGVCPECGRMGVG